MKRKWNSGEASTSNYLPSPEATSEKFDVFLSFRGPDTRDKFTSHLYESLTRVGFSVFKDDVQMVEGEGINEALRTAINCSRICIPIFSKNYASSKACLQELSQMVLEDKIIIPIFYDVRVDDVKLKTNLYKMALEDHHREGRVGKEEIEKWEKALLEVAKILGHNMVNKNEANEIIKITQQVMNRLMPKDQDVTKHLVEIDDEVESVIKMMDSNFEGCCIIGLCGMGGIGKTTLAQAVFNRLSVNFGNCRTFIANVRESVENNQLPKLQKQLYKDLIDPRFADSIDNTNGGINMINKGLMNKKFLLVLDDLDSANLLTKLVGDPFRFANGSRIIITTRDKKVLDDLEKDLIQLSNNLDALEKDPIQPSNNDQARLKVYQVQQLDKNRALQLFSRCAFRRDSPPENFKSLSEVIISSLGGLPLALEVIGSLLLCHSEKAWEETIERLKETPNEKIRTFLMISYEKLHKDEQKIFLDIACYPGSLEKTGAYYMWESCGRRPSVSIVNLINQSLIKVVRGGGLWMNNVLEEEEEEEERLWMHDLLKEFGRDIIRKKHKKKRRKGRRFLQIDENFGGIPKEERKYVEMLRICYRGIVTRDDLDGFENVRFLYLQSAKVEGNFEGLFPNLRWIEIFNVFDFSVVNLNPEKLVVLMIWGCHSDVMHTFWSQMKAHKLKVLISWLFFKMEQTPSFKEFSSLEVLILHGPSNMVNSMGDLKSLIRFEMDWDDSNACLPQNIGNAEALEEIVFKGHYLEFELPASVYNLEKLSRLCLNRVDMRALKDSIGNLISLRELDLSHTFITALPNAIGQLQKLRILRLNECAISEFPTTIGGLMKLEVLEAQDCLDFKGDIPGEISMLSCLRILNLKGTPIYGMPKLPSSLTHLHMGLFTDRNVIYSHSLVDLVELELCCRRHDTDADDLDGKDYKVYLKCLDFQWIGRLSMLKKLHLCIPYAITGLESVNSLSRLKELNLSFAKLQDNWQLPSTLSNLEFNDCKFDILDVSHAKKLRRLAISRCDMREIRGLSELNSLRELEVHELEGLSSLKVWNCKSLEYVVGFDGLESLSNLSIEDCPSLRSLPDLSTLENLQYLKLHKLERLGCIKGLALLEFLVEVQITGCQSLKLDPNDLCKLNNTRIVLIKNCDKLPRVFFTIFGQELPRILKNGSIPQAFIPRSTSMDGNTVAFDGSRPRRCATHCYIAQSISYFQQFMSMNPFQSAAATASSSNLTYSSAKLSRVKNFFLLGSKRQLSSITRMAVEEIAEGINNMNLSGDSQKKKRVRLSRQEVHATIQ